MPAKKQTTEAKDSDNKQEQQPEAEIKETKQPAAKKQTLPEAGQVTTEVYVKPGFKLPEHSSERDVYVVLGKPQYNQYTGKRTDKPYTMPFSLEAWNQIFIPMQVTTGLIVEEILHLPVGAIVPHVGMLGETTTV